MCIDFDVVLDKGKLQTLAKDIGGDNFFRIYQLFTDETKNRLNQLVSLLVSSQLENVRKEAHRMSSSVLSFGLLRYGHYLRCIENELHETRSAYLLDMAEKVQALHAEAIEQLQDYVKKYYPAH